MLCLRGSGMPLFAWAMNGSIADVATLAVTLQYLEKLEYRPNCLMMDRAFGTRANITYMMERKHVFLQSLKVASNWVYRLVDFGKDDRFVPTSHVAFNGQSFYASSTKCLWVRCINTKGKEAREEIIVYPLSGKKGGKYVSDDPGVRVAAQYPCTVHVAFCQDLVGKSHDEFMAALKGEYIRLTNDEKAEVKKECRNYFAVTKEKFARHRKVSFNIQAIEKHRNIYEGHICYLTNDQSISTAEDALKEYSTRDKIEKDFDDMKNSLDMKRLHVHTDSRMRSRLFIQFVAEILRCEIRNCLSASDACKKMTQSQFSNQLKTITKTKFAGKYNDVHSPLSKTQRDIIEAIGVVVK
jgi:transposase